MGGSAPTNSQANNTNTTNANTTVGNLGLTGQNAVDALNTISNNTSWGNFYANQLSQLFANQGANVGLGLGRQGADAGVNFAAAGSAVAYSLGNFGAETARNFTNAANTNAALGYEFGTNTITTSAALFDRTTARITDTLTGTINAVRDTNQRNLNAGVGQVSPIQVLPAAASNIPVLDQFSNSSKTNLWLIVGVVVIFGFFLLRK
jgi:hypothetical protein